MNRVKGLMNNLLLLQNQHCTILKLPKRFTSSNRGADTLYHMLGECHFVA